MLKSHTIFQSQKVFNYSIYRSVVCFFIITLPIIGLAQPRVGDKIKINYELEDGLNSNSIRVIEPLELNDSIFFILEIKEESIDVILTYHQRMTSKLIYKRGKLGETKILSLAKESDSLVSWIEKHETFSYLVYFNVYTREVKHLKLDFSFVDFKVAKRLHLKAFVVLSYLEGGISLGVYDLAKKKLIIQKEFALQGAYLSALEQVKLHALGSDKVVISEGTNFKILLLDSNLNTLDVWSKTPQWWKYNKDTNQFKRQFLSMKRDSLYDSYLKYSSIECVEFIGDTSFVSIRHVPGYIGSVLLGNTWSVPGETINYGKAFYFPFARKTSAWRPAYGPIGNYYYYYYKILNNGVFHCAIWEKDQQDFISFKVLKKDALYRPISFRKKHVFNNKKVHIEFFRWAQE